MSVIWCPNYIGHVVRHRYYLQGSCFVLFSYDLVFSQFTHSLWGYFTGTGGCPIVSEHYSDVIMSAMASEIASLTIVYSTVYSGSDQRKHQSFASLAFVRKIHRWPVNSPHKGPVTQKMFPCDDVIMQNNHSKTNHNKNLVHIQCDILYRDHSVYWFNQWETTLKFNVVSHWLCPYTEWSLSSQLAYMESLKSENFHDANFNRCQLCRH